MISVSWCHFLYFSHCSGPETLRAKATSLLLSPYHTALWSEGWAYRWEENPHLFTNKEVSSTEYACLEIRICQACQDGIKSPSRLCWAIPYCCIYIHTHTLFLDHWYLPTTLKLWLNLNWVHSLKHAWHMSRVMEGALLCPFIPQLCWHIQVTANSNPKTVFSPLSLSLYHVCIIETMLFCSYRLPHGWPGVGGWGE